jgi:membrane fusion protein, multidrug efflux system
LKLRTLMMLMYAGTCLIGCGGSSEQESDVVPVASVRVAKASQETLQTAIEGVGQVSYSPQRVHAVTTAAEVRVLRVMVAAGETADSGDLLMVVEPSATSRADLSRAHADLDFSEQELSRLEKLRKQELATNAELAAARLARTKARVALDTMQSQLGNPQGEIRADYDALVAVVDAQQGDIVSSGAPLLHLADRSVMRVRVGVEPADLSLLRDGLPVRISASYDARVEASGRIIKLTSQIDPQTGLAAALVDIDGGSGLLAGAWVRTRIELDPIADAVLVPRSAVLFDADGNKVFVVVGGKVTRRLVEIGSRTDSQIQIRSGIKAGEAVVVEGNHELEDGMAVRIAAGE